MPGPADGDGAVDHRARRHVPAPDLEALAGAQAPGARDLGVGAGAALPAERPEVDAVALDERAQDAGIGGQPILRARGTTQRGVGRPTVSSSPDGAWRRPPRSASSAKGCAVGAVVEHEVGAKAPDVPVRSRGPRRADAPACRVVMRWIGARSWYAPVAPKRPSAGVSERSRRTRRPSSSESARFDLGALERAAVGQRDAQRRVLVAVVEQLGPARAQARIGRAALVRDPLAGRGVDDDPPPVAFAASRSDGHGVEQLAEHRLDRIAPDGQDSHRRIFAQLAAR